MFDGGLTPDVDNIGAKTVRFDLARMSDRTNIVVAQEFAPQIEIDPDPLYGVEHCGIFGPLVPAKSFSR